MSTKLQKPEPSSQDVFMALIEQVINSPEATVEKLDALIEAKFKLEDRRAEAEFDAAMIEAQDEVQELKWDKLNLTNQSRNVSYPKIDKMLRPVRKKYGFTQSYDTEPGPTPDQVWACCDVVHKSGHRRRYRLPMPVDASGPKGGGVMTKPQAVGSGMSYSMRNLAKMIWNIPMLVDKDDNDGNTPYQSISEKQAADLKSLAEETKTDLKKFCQYYKIDKLENLPATSYESAVKAFEKKRRRS